MTEQCEMNGNSNENKRWMKMRDEMKFEWKLEWLKCAINGN